jgi:membrane protease YdiL (CAAX protease family)
MLVRYLISIPGLAGLLWWMHPSLMFLLLRRHPGIWLLILVAYPILSVFPQELIYRAFFFERYRPLFGRKLGRTLASAIAFAFGHLVFHNPVAVVLTFLGGWLFATTYQRTSSLLCVSAEHALYGCTLFSLGYGPFFVDRFWWGFG